MRYQWLRYLLVALCILPIDASMSAQTNTPAVTLPSTPAQTQNAFSGSVASGPASSGPLSLSLDEALKRGLRYNLGAINSQQGFRLAHGESTVALSQLLPHLSANALEIDQQIGRAIAKMAPGNIVFKGNQRMRRIDLPDGRSGLWFSGRRQPRTGHRHAPDHAVCRW